MEKLKSCAVCFKYSVPTYVSHFYCFFSSPIIPLAVLTCSDDSSPTSSSATSSPTQIRLIVNDGVMSLTGIEGCPEQKDGMCPVETFIASQKKLLEATDWDWTCHGNWSVPEGDAWRTLTGDPPAKDE